MVEFQFISPRFLVVLNTNVQLFMSYVSKNLLVMILIHTSCTGCIETVKESSATNIALIKIHVNSPFAFCLWERPEWINLKHMFQ